MSQASAVRLEALKKKLRDHQIQPSASRLAIADYVLCTEDHPTAEEVKSSVEKTFPSLCIATVYNTLHLFEEKGLVISVRDPHTKVVRYDCRVEPHFHFLDEASGRLYDLDPKALRVLPNASMLQDGVQIRSIDVTVRGQLPESPQFILTRTAERLAVGSKSPINNDNPGSSDEQ